MFSNYFCGVKFNFLVGSIQILLKQNNFFKKVAAYTLDGRHTSFWYEQP